MQEAGTYGPYGSVTPPPKYVTNNNTETVPPSKYIKNHNTQTVPPPKYVTKSPNHVTVPEIKCTKILDQNSKIPMSDTNFMWWQSPPPIYVTKYPSGFCYATGKQILLVEQHTKIWLLSLVMPGGGINACFFFAEVCALIVRSPGIGSFPLITAS